jgi:polar amino acid transport system substrate-binding protein
MGRHGWWLGIWLGLGLVGMPGLGMALPLASESAVNFISEEWPPYNYIEQGRLTGVSVKIVQALQQELGRSDPIQVYPSQRAKLILESRSRTMMFSMFRTPQRETRYKWIGPIGRDAIYFYQRGGSPLQIRTLQDAKAVAVIASRQAGLVFNILIADGFTNLDSSAYSSKQVYGKLLRGRAELAISDSPLGVRYLLKQMGLPADALQQTPVKVVESDLYIAASLDFPDTEIAQWQQALDRLKARGELDRLSRGLP